MLILYKNTIRKKGTSLYIRLNITKTQILLGMPSSNKGPLLLLCLPMHIGYDVCFVMNVVFT